jgi:hypothetical protein
MSTGLQVTSQSNFVHEVLLRRGKIELINQEIFSSALFIEFGELKGVERRRGTGCRTGVFAARAFSRVSLGRMPLNSAVMTSLIRGTNRSTTATINM